MCLSIICHVDSALGEAVGLSKLYPHLHNGDGNRTRLAELRDCHENKLFKGLNSVSGTQ